LFALASSSGPELLSLFFPGLLWQAALVGLRDGWVGEGME
jgi:hypothetical protein